MVTIHCADTPNGKFFSVVDIRQWHLARGFSDVGYHKVILIDGGVQQGRPDTTLGAHVAGHNNGNLGICLIGRDKFTRAQFDALKWVVKNYCAAYNIGENALYGHYEFDTAIAQGKSCPNMSIARLKAWIFNDSLDAILKYILDPQ